MENKKFLSPSGRFELIIEKGKENIKAKLFSRITKDLCGKVKYPNHFRNSSSSNFCLPFCFFIKDKKEYLISGISDTNYTIIYCDKGHILEKNDQVEKTSEILNSQGNFLWSEIKQVNEQTFYVFGEILGVSQIYNFYDFSNQILFCKPL